MILSTDGSPNPISVPKVFETSEEYQKEKNKINEKIENCLNLEKVNFTAYDINWLNDHHIKTYDDVKIYNHNAIIDMDKLVLTAHHADTIIGKPQLVHQTIQRIPMIKKVEKYFKAKKKGEEDQVIIKYYFIDDKYDKRYDGNEVESLAFDFYVYRVVDNKKEYFLFSGEELKQEFCEFTGMVINVDDSSELNNNLKVRKVSSIFLVKEAKPFVKVLNRRRLVEFTKECKQLNKWDEKGFMDYIFTHPDGKIYCYTEEFNYLRVAQLLSSKYEGYPLHILKMGPVGTGKTTEAETLYSHFDEDQKILEAGNSTLKVLVPSFKEKPADLGYICMSNRVAIIDELMKMIEKTLVTSENHNQRVSSYLGQLNMLLEHKYRTVGSGNNNSADIQATAKVCFTTNNLTGKDSIYSHVGLIDDTTLSRMCIWVQDLCEVNKIYCKEGVKANSNLTVHTDLNPIGDMKIEKNSNDSLCVYRISNSNNCVIPNDVVVKLRNDFLTIYDSCQQFLVDYDELRVKEAFRNAGANAKDPMRRIWASRGLHHSILILDGLVKYRCLFRDHDDRFIPIEEDYQILNKVLLKMVANWDTKLSGENWQDMFK